MSLDVSLIIPDGPAIQPREAIFVRRGGANVEISRAEWDAENPGIEPVTTLVEAGESGEVYWANITHNLGRMADAAGIYQHLWRPEELGITKAAELIEPLTAGLAALKADRTKFEAFNSPNGWGLYEHFIPFVEKYLTACIKSPEATVSVCR